MPWFKGSPSTIIEAINSISPPQRIYDVPARVPIITVQPISSHYLIYPTNNIPQVHKVSGIGTVAVGMHFYCPHHYHYNNSGIERKE